MEGHACQGLQLAIHAKIQGIIMSDSVILSKMKFNCANILILTCTYELKRRAENLTALTVIRRVLRQLIIFINLNVFYVLGCTMLKSSK